MHELKIAYNYPNSYWLEYDRSNIGDYDLMLCKKIKITGELFLKARKKVSDKKLSSYDFLFSDGPITISPRLASLLSDSKGFFNDVQLIDATLIINGINHTGYKIINIIRLLSCIDMDKSDSQPILSYLPNGPRKFNSIFFREDVTENFFMARCSEYNSCIVISNELRNLFIENNVTGLEL